MRFGFLLAALLMSSAPAQAYRDQPSEPGQFDYYLLNLSWEPEFCHSRRNADSEECTGAMHGFVVHGLWPQNMTGYPEHCSHVRGPRNANDYLDIMPTSWLVEHEWSTHGTCSGLAPEEYFGKIRQAFKNVTIPDMLKAPARPLTVTPAAIKQAFVKANPGLRAEAMAVSCGNNYLSAVEICLSKDLKPTTCGTLRDCHANVVKVAPVR